MERREFMSLVGGTALAWPLAAHAQISRAFVIGVLSPESSSVGDVEGLREGLRELGYVEGRDIKYEYRWAAGDFSRLPEMADELIATKVDVLVTYVTQASLVAKKATSSIPIVMVGVADPVGVGLIASLAFPGGNVTGTSSIASTVAAKQLDLLRVISPGVSRIAALWNPANFEFQTLQVNQAKAAASAAGVALQLFEARAADQFEGAFSAIKEAGLRELLILLDPLFISNFPRLVELSNKEHFIVMTGYRKFVDAGGLMSYGPNYRDIYRQTAIYVDKILRGANPADLPVQQPTKFEFIVNLKTAKTLNLTVPDKLLTFADEVIE
jgi:putative tryptophan/tyrosine transport system substrate-binding protein